MLLERLKRELQPYLGDRVADVALRLQCQALHLDPLHLAPAHLAALTARLEPALEVFMGARKAARVAQTLLGLDEAKGARA